MADEKELVPPVVEGEIIKEQKVINLGKKGDGVFKYDGYIIFVADCQIDEIVTFRITKVFKNMALGEKVEEED